MLGNEILVEVSIYILYYMVYKYHMVHKVSKSKPVPIFSPLFSDSEIYLSIMIGGTQRRASYL